MIRYLHILQAVAPETVVVIAALAVLAVDVLVTRDLPSKFRKTTLALFSATGCALAAAWALAIPNDGTFLDGMLVVSQTAAIVKAGLLFMSGVTLFLWVDSEPRSHPSEYCALVLLATVGMMFMASAGDLLLLFISLELSSVCLYVLTGLDKNNPLAAEAAMKYFLFGGVAAAFTLFGISLVYGIAGTTRLDELGGALLAASSSTSGPLSRPDPLIVMGILMMLGAFAFKIAAVPFHLWAPDVYQGAPIASAGLIASGSKLAGFFVLGQLATEFASGGDMSLRSSSWLPVIGALACASMVLGNLAALAQDSVRRLLAYSAIAHGGYMLIAVMAPSERGLAALVYYAITYALAGLGAFAAVSIVEQTTGGDKFQNFAGLSRSSPVLALCMLVFMLSLAGIPPLAGFFGKFYVFAAALGAGRLGWSLLGLVVLAAGASAVSLYYYLKVLKQVYVADAAIAPAGTVPWLALMSIVLLACLVVLLGCFPEALIGHLSAGIAPR